MSNIALIEDLVLSARPQFEAVTVDRSIGFDREAGFAIQVLAGNEFALKTALTNKASVVAAVSNIAAVGLSLNPAKKQAYLVPRDGKICLDISYMGLLDLAIDSGSIKWGQAELVHQADQFHLNGIDKAPTHQRDPFKEDRGEIVGAYVVVKTADGDYLTTAMKLADILAIRDRSSAWKNGQKGPWKTDPGEMMKKTVIKRAYKTWPKTDRLDTAIHHLNTDGEEGLDESELTPIDQPKNFGLTPERAKVVRAAANASLQKFNEGDEMGAYEEVSWIDDNEEKLALWSVLKPHSALRSAIKRLALAEVAKQAEIDKLKAGATDVTPKGE
jgi:recombination protein RecT